MWYNYSGQATHTCISRTYDWNMDEKYSIRHAVLVHNWEKEEAEKTGKWLIVVVCSCFTLIHSFIHRVLGPKTNDRTTKKQQQSEQWKKTRNPTCDLHRNERVVDPIKYECSTQPSIRAHKPTLVMLRITRESERTPKKIYRIIARLLKITHDTYRFHIYSHSYGAMFTRISACVRARESMEYRQCSDSNNKKSSDAVVLGTTCLANRHHSCSQYLLHTIAWIKWG